MDFVIIRILKQIGGKKFRSNIFSQVSIFFYYIFSRHSFYFSINFFIIQNFPFPSFSAFCTFIRIMQKKSSSQVICVTNVSYQFRVSSGTDYVNKVNHLQFFGGPKGSRTPLSRMKTTCPNRQTMGPIKLILYLLYILNCFND